MDPSVLRTGLSVNIKRSDGQEKQKKNIYTAIAMSLLPKRCMVGSSIQLIDVCVFHVQVVFTELP